jgi:hypothetical protein
MILKLFIDGKNFECLKRSVSPGSKCHTALTQAAHLSNIVSPKNGSVAVVTCDDVAARDLLGHARENCPRAATRIAEAFRAAGLTP